MITGGLTGNDTENEEKRSSYRECGINNPLASKCAASQVSERREATVGQPLAPLRRGLLALTGMR